MTETEHTDADIVAIVRQIQARLDAAGWVRANALGEQATPDSRLWFITVYTHGEYTVETNYRDRGYGKPEGACRIRITPTLARNHPGLADVLATDLIDKAREIEDGTSILDVAWPPQHWAEFAR